MILLLVESLDSRGIIDQGDNDISVAGSIAGVDEDAVAVKDAGIDHGVAADSENERFTGGNELGGNREIAHDVFLGKDRKSRRNISDFGDRGHLCAYDLKTVVADLDRAGLSGITPDIAVLLQCCEMSVY